MNRLSGRRVRRFTFARATLVAAVVTVAVALSPPASAGAADPVELQPITNGSQVFASAAASGACGPGSDPDSGDSEQQVARSSQVSFSLTVSAQDASQCATPTSLSDQTTTSHADSGGAAIDSEASLNANSTTHGSAQADGNALLKVDITVNGTPVPYTITGSLDQPGGTWDQDGGVQVSLSASSSVFNFQGDGPISQSGTIQPGQYRLEALANCNPAAGSGICAGTWNFGLELGEPSECSGAASFSTALADSAILHMPTGLAEPLPPPTPDDPNGSRPRPEVGPPRTPSRVVTRTTARAARGVGVTAATRGPPRVRRIVPKAAVAGAAISIRGHGLRGKRTRVTVGGRRAKIVSARPKELRIVVPRAKPGLRSLVVKRRKDSVARRFRVLKPFRGRIRAKPDRRRARRGTIGPRGGKVTATGADRTRYTLRVPAGGLARRKRIAVTPVARYRGLPFTGGRVAGVDLAPNGLRFLRPATLEIRPTRRFPANTVGFGYDAGGRGLDLQTPTRKGRVLRLQIHHFSGDAGGSVNEADFANVAGPIINSPGPLSLSQIRQLIDLIAVFADVFDRPGDPFCQRQPICDQVVGEALDSLRAMIDEQCALAAANHDITRLATVLSLEGLRVSFGGQAPISLDCQERIFSNEIAVAAATARADPYGLNESVDDLPAARIDLDSDGGITNFEWLTGLAFNAHALGFTTLGPVALGETRSILADLPGRGRNRCASDRAGGEADLVRGLNYAIEIDEVSSIGQPLLEQFLDALDFCRLGVRVAPDSVTLIGGTEAQLEAIVTGLIHPPNNSDVTWTTTGGAIDQSGRYTAPTTNGTFEVRATSTLNTSRFDTATVHVEGCPAS